MEASTKIAWSVVFTLSFLGLILFAALSFFVVICFVKTRQSQPMEQQNDTVSSDQQIRITDEKKGESLVDSIQSTQKSVNDMSSMNRMKHCDIQADNKVINEKRNTIPENISKDLQLELINTTPEINERTAGNPSMQLQSLYCSVYQSVPKTPSVIVKQEERTGRDGNGNQSSNQITSTLFAGNPALTLEMPLTDKKSAQEISNNFSCELISSHSTTKHSFPLPIRFGLLILSNSFMRLLLLLNQYNHNHPKDQRYISTDQEALFSCLIQEWEV